MSFEMEIRLVNKQELDDMLDLAKQQAITLDETLKAISKWQPMPDRGAFAKAE